MATCRSAVSKKASRKTREALLLLYFTYQDSSISATLYNTNVLYTIANSSSSGTTLAPFAILANPCKPLFFGLLSLSYSFTLLANLLPKSSQKVVFPTKK